MKEALIVILTNILFWGAVVIVVNSSSVRWLAGLVIGIILIFYLILGVLRLLKRLGDKAERKSLAETFEKHGKSYALVFLGYIGGIIALSSFTPQNSEPNIKGWFFLILIFICLGFLGLFLLRENDQYKESKEN